MQNIKQQFPIFKSQPDLVYLDTAATALKPQSVIDSLVDYYSNYSANIHRGLYKNAEKATELYEESRSFIADFMGVESEEILFTKNATEGFNLLASCLSGTLSEEDTLMTTLIDHHSNFVPWQRIAREKKAAFFVLKHENDEIPQDIKICAVPLISNVTGELINVEKIVAKVKLNNPNAITILDACQAVTTLNIKDYVSIVDAIVFSGHKTYGPTGVGVVYVKKSLLASFPPYQTGGGMIEEVTIDNTTYQQAPYKFEAGTPPIAEVIALKYAIEFIIESQKSEPLLHICTLSTLTKKRLEEEFGENVHIINPMLSETIHNGIISFYIDNVHAHDIAHILGEENICVRAGHHCTMPLHKELCIPASVRVSFGIYNDEHDVEKFIEGMKKVMKILK